MNVCIIVFSPSGHTLSVAQMMQKAFNKNDTPTQLINITGEKAIFNENKTKEFLIENVKPHDLLLIGGPVYAGHIESNVKELIKNIPQPNETWGNLAIPFITYGGVHSSIALKELGDLLHDTTRINLMGAKFAKFHTLTKTLDFKINENKPNDEEEKTIQEMIKRMNALVSSQQYKDVASSFSYCNTKEKMIFNLLSQDFFHKKYRNFNINTDKCIGCGKCAKNCPVNRIVIKNKKAFIPEDSNTCILCAECYHNCPANAIEYNYITQKASKRLAKGKDSLEIPQSAIYPIDND